MANFSETSDAFKTELMGGNKFMDTFKQMRQMALQMPKAKDELQKRLIITLILFGVFWHLDQDLDNKIIVCYQSTE